MITESQRNILAHMLGGVVPEKWFRNRFCAGPGHTDLPDLEAMEKIGLVERQSAPSWMGGDCIPFFVTDKGKSVFQ